MNNSIIVNDVDLFVQGDIGSEFSAEFFIQQLNSIPKGETINVHIFSGGGNPFAALAVYDFVKLKGIKFNAFVSGLVGSAATIIAAAAEKTEIGANSFFFIHRALRRDGEPNAQQQATLDSINERMINIYKDVTGLSKPQIKKLLDAGDKGLFLDATQAKDLGFVDDKFKEDQLAASMEFHKEYKSNINMNQIEEKLSEWKEEIFAKIETLKGGKEKVSEEEINAKIDEVFTAKVKTYEDQIIALESEKLELTNKVGELETKSIEGKTYKTEFKAKAEEFEKTIEALETKVGEYEGKPTTVKKTGDPNPVGEEPVVITANAKVLNDIIASYTPAEKFAMEKRNKK